MNNLIFVSFLSLLLIVPLSCSTNRALLSAEELSVDYVSKKKNNALVIGYFKDGKQHVGVYAGKGSKGFINEESIFEIGAVTQVFTTSLMLKMHQDGYFDPEDCVNAYLSDGKKIPDYQPSKCVNVSIDPDLPEDLHVRRPIEFVSCYPDPLSTPECFSFCELADHSSGIMELPGGYHWYPFGYFYQKKSFIDNTVDNFFDRLNDVSFAFGPGENYYYSTTGMATLGNALAEISDKKFTKLMKEKLLLPLGLEHTSFHANASGYLANGKKAPPWNFDAYEPAGGLKSTVGDLLQFLAAQLDNNNEWAVVFHEAHLPRKQTVHKKNNRLVSGAYGWFISPITPGSVQQIYWMNGGTAGFRSFIAFNKTEGTAVVVLSNSASDIDEIGFKLMSEISAPKNNAALPAILNE